MSNVSYITEEGLKKLREELIQLESIERPRISKQLLIFAYDLFFIFS
ncbi:MAG: hypothetical protein LBV41_10640 [Cytophagaceae bacterium]|jgi:transcription elongation factor GreA|nr:hypothetical protein [Cytophagaceae bacterium]